MSKLVVDEASLVSVADAIRTKGGTSESLEFPNGFVDAVNGIESGGGDNPWLYADLTYGLSFRGATFPENYHLIFRALGNANSVNFGNVFSYNNAKKITLKIETVPETLSLYNAFIGCSKLTEVVFENDIISPTSSGNAFMDCANLEVISGKLDFSKITTGNHNSTFSKCYALREVRFVEHSIKVTSSFADLSKLSAESKQSIFDGLATVGTAQTLTFNPNAKILQSQVDSANAKGWTVAGGTVVSEEEYYG